MNLLPRNSSGKLTAGVLHRTRNPASSRGRRRHRSRMDTHAPPTSSGGYFNTDTASAPDQALSPLAPGVLADNDVNDPSLPPQTTQGETLPSPVQSMLRDNTNTNINTLSTREQESTGTPLPQRDNMNHHTLMDWRPSSRIPTGKRYKSRASH